MTTRFAVRTLKTTGPGVLAATTWVRPWLQLTELGARRLAAVYDVEADQASLTREEVVEHLRGGALRSSDLIFAHGRWNTLLEHEEFGALAARRARSEGLRRGLRQVATFLLFATPAILYVSLRFWLIGHHRGP
jgi:hypothetical protein